MKATRARRASAARLPARKIAGLQSRWTEAWHAAKDGAVRQPLAALVREQHRRNFDLWHEEDKARAPDATDAQIARVKRNIDRLNQQRNDLIEELDEQIAVLLQARRVKPRAAARWNSETPGSIIDRLSILSLKVFHMREQTERHDAAPEHLARARARLQVLRQQRKDLTAALEELLGDVFSGRRQMKLYRQFKMYNDPSMNPAIYGAKTANG